MPQLVLIRHGQSTWNLENRFTGWWDVDVTEKRCGRSPCSRRADERQGAGFRLLLHLAAIPARSRRSISRLKKMGRLWLPVEKDYRLNERHYGGLTGLDKAENSGQAWRSAG